MGGTPLSFYYYANPQYIPSFQERFFRMVPILCRHFQGIIARIMPILLGCFSAAFEWLRQKMPRQKMPH